MYGFHYNRRNSVSQAVASATLQRFDSTRLRIGRRSGVVLLLLRKVSRARRGSDMRGLDDTSSIVKVNLFIHSQQLNSLDFIAIIPFLIILNIRLIYIKTMDALSYNIKRSLAESLSFCFYYIIIIMIRTQVEISIY